MRLVYSATALGIALLAALLLWYGIDDIAFAVASTGWGLVLVAIARLVQMAAAGIAWRVLLPEQGTTPSAAIFVLLRWIRESINNLLPVVQVGGDFVGARLLKSFGATGGQAGASVLVDMLVQVATQLIFTAVGIAVLVELDASPTLVQTAIAGLGLLAAGILGFFLVQRFGFGWLESRLAPLARRWTWVPMHQAGALDAHLQALFAARGRLAAAGVIHLATWFFGASEIWIALSFMGQPVTWAEALVIESLGQAVRGAAFMVPGGIGVQESGFVALCSVFGLSPPVAIALSLVKRVAELVLGLPGLVAWHFLERRPALHRPG